MSRVAEWVERLKAETDFTVRGAAELAVATADQKSDTVYVVPLYESSDAPSDVAGPARQMVTVGVGVVLAVTNRRDKRGEAALDEIDEARERVRAALLGWTPASAQTPVAFRRGQMMTLAASTVWWRDEYETTLLRTEEAA